MQDAVHQRFVDEAGERGLAVGDVLAVAQKTGAGQAQLLLRGGPARESVAQFALRGHLGAVAADLRTCSFALSVKKMRAD